MKQDPRISPSAQSPCREDTPPDPNPLLYYYKNYMKTYLDLTAANETICELNRELEQARDMTDSLSWKVTKPLRWLRDRIAKS